MGFLLRSGSRGLALGGEWNRGPEPQPCGENRIELGITGVFLCWRPRGRLRPALAAGRRLIEALRAGEMIGEVASGFGTRSRGSGSVTYGAVLEGAQETTRLGGAKGRTGPPPALS